MPKRKVRQSFDRTQHYIKILTNLQILHSPCVTEACTVPYRHCAGCNESFPCKTAQVLTGHSVAQINRQIEAMETTTIYGDQADGADNVENPAEPVD